MYIIFLLIKKLNILTESFKNYKMYFIYKINDCIIGMLDTIFLQLFLFVL